MIPKDWTSRGGASTESANFYFLSTRREEAVEEYKRREEGQEYKRREAVEEYKRREEGDTVERRVEGGEAGRRWHYVLSSYRIGQHQTWKMSIH